MLDTYRKWVPFRLQEVKDQEEVWREFRQRIADSRREGCFYINGIED